MRLGIAEDAMVHALVQSFEDRGGGGEIHVGDPERIELRAAVVFDTAGPAALDQGVEVEMHGAGLVAVRRESFKSGVFGGRMGDGMVKREPGR